VYFYAPFFNKFQVVNCIAHIYIVYLSEATDVVHLILYMVHSWIIYFAGF
jgi:hypothetical protein